MKCSVSKKDYIKGIYNFDKLSGINQYLRALFTKDNEFINIEIKEDCIFISENNVEIKLRKTSIIRI
ncbi:MAG: hypothetical protein ACRC6T_02145 [Sarcina sp.]